MIIANDERSLRWKLAVIDDQAHRSPEWKALRQYYLDKLNETKGETNGNRQNQAAQA